MANSQSFDIENFGTSVINSVDSIRASISVGSTTQSESRINALYRAIGLPSIIGSGVSIGAVSASQKIDGLNTGNTFTEKDLGVDGNSIAFSFIERELSFTAPVTFEEISTALDVSNFSLSSGVSSFGNTHTIIPDSSQSTFTRERGLLFPMVVNGDLLVLPQNKRVAGAFFTDKQLIIGDVTYRRPLIENIISISLRGEGVNNSALNSELINNLNIPTNQLPHFSINVVSSQIVESLLNTLESLKSITSDTLQNLSVIRDEENKIIIATAGNIPGESLNIDDFLGSTSETGSISEYEAQIQDAKNVNNIFFTLIDYQDSDTIGTKNAKDSVLSSNLFSLVNDSSEFDKKLQEIAQQKETLKNKLQQAQTVLDLLTGQFSGVSAVDIIVIFLALFLIPQKNLIGLLNNDAISRLNAVKNVSFSSPGTVDTMINSVSVLQKTIQVLYAGIDETINIKSITKNQDNQSTGSGV